MEKKKNLASLSKNATKKNTSTKKTTTSKGKKTGTTNKKTVVSDRDLKAKETVDKLLNEVPLTNKKDENKTESKEIKKGTEWLEEQLQILTEKNVALEKQAEEEKNNYKKIYDDFRKLKQSKSESSEKETILKLFNELQDNYGKFGKKFRVYFPAFLNRMIMFFPFLSNHKKY